MWKSTEPCEASVCRIFIKLSIIMHTKFCYFGERIVASNLTQHNYFRDRKKIIAWCMPFHCTTHGLKKGTRSTIYTIKNCGQVYFGRWKRWHVGEGDVFHQRWTNFITSLHARMVGRGCVKGICIKIQHSIFHFLNFFIFLCVPYFLVYIHVIVIYIYKRKVGMVEWQIMNELRVIHIIACEL